MESERQGSATIRQTRHRQIMRLGAAPNMIDILDFAVRIPFETSR
jgi:hypothetical protein